MNYARAIWLGSGMLAAAAATAADLTWPPPVMPPDAALQSPGEHMAVNGLPMRIYRFATAQTQEDLTHEFRRHIDGNFVRSAPAGTDPRTTLAGRVGGFWITLQMTSAPDGATRATWSAAPRFIEGAQLPVVKPPGFPRSARLLQQVDSFDDGKNSQLAVGLDTAAIDAVVARLQEDLRNLGYVKQAFPPRNWNGDAQYSAVFANGREELVVSLTRERRGTAVTINRISALERLK